jgi:hypothetical protein
MSDNWNPPPGRSPHEPEPEGDQPDDGPVSGPPRRDGQSPLWWTDSPPEQLEYLKPVEPGPDRPSGPPHARRSPSRPRSARTSSRSTSPEWTCSGWACSRWTCSRWPRPTWTYSWRTRPGWTRPRRTYSRRTRPGQALAEWTWTAAFRAAAGPARSEQPLVVGISRAVPAVPAGRATAVPRSAAGHAARLAVPADPDPEATGFGPSSQAAPDVEGTAVPAGRNCRPCGRLRRHRRAAQRRQRQPHHPGGG